MSKDIKIKTEIIQISGILRDDFTAIINKYMGRVLNGIELYNLQEDLDQLFRLNDLTDLKYKIKTSPDSPNTIEIIPLRAIDRYAFAGMLGLDI